MDNIENILKTTQITNEPTTVLLALLFCCVSGYLLKFFYDKYSNYNLSNNKISSILPILTIVTFLIITIIKSSIALSLGLVGALSIVRFRTPIKEPEELLFLFLSIALGIGYGSNQIQSGFPSPYCVFVECCRDLQNGFASLPSAISVLRGTRSTFMPVVPTQRRCVPWRSVQYRQLRVAHHDDRSSDRIGTGRIHPNVRRRALVQQPL